MSGQSWATTKRDSHQPTSASSPPSCRAFGLTFRLQVVLAFIEAAEDAPRQGAEEARRDDGPRPDSGLSEHRIRPGYLAVTFGPFLVIDNRRLIRRSGASESMHTRARIVRRPLVSTQLAAADRKPLDNTFVTFTGTGGCRDHR
jgi:hypothetical protein